jgi:hypothetical protein
MKQVGTTHWFGPNTDATNSSGFTALPGGYRYDNGSYVSLVEFYSGQRNQRQVLGCEFVDGGASIRPLVCQCVASGINTVWLSFL